MRVCFIAIGFLFYAMQSARAEAVTLVADEWCPYNCVAGSDKEGFLVDIARAALAPHGITVVYENVPWSRAIINARKGEYDGIVGAAHDDAKDFVFPQIPQVRMQNVFYASARNDWKYEGVESLSAVSLGLIKDYSYGDEMDAYIASYARNMRYVQLIAGDDALTINIRKLRAGRIGATIESNAVMAYTLLQQGGAEDIRVAGEIPSSEEDDLFIAFSPANPRSKHYAMLLDTFMHNESQAKNALMQRYGLNGSKQHE